MHRIVIVGGGAGGLELATRLGRTLGKKRKARVTLVDAHLTHIWKPLLHEVATGSLNSTDNELNYVAQANWNHFEFQIGRLNGLDRETRRISLSATLDEQGNELVPARTMGYDSLVIAVGSVTNDFGTKGAAEHCIFLDAPKQALNLHRKLLSHYLSAHAREETGDHLNVAIVGAGATGVELAAELHNAAQELAAYGLNSIEPQNMRINLIEAGPRVLPALPERIGSAVLRELEKLGVIVRTSSPVKAITDDGMIIADGTFVPATLKVWAAGIRAPAFLKDINGLETNRINQLVVKQNLQTSRDENIFALGDCAACPMGDGSDKNVPPRAQTAHQQASLLATSLKNRLEGKPIADYQYKDYGSLVSLAKFSAVGNLMGSLMGSVKVEGWLARMFYISLYRMHQMALYGMFRTGLLMLSDRIGRKTNPRMKLH
jgi:NADH dehydrogenase